LLDDGVGEIEPDSHKSQYRANVHVGTAREARRRPDKCMAAGTAARGQGLASPTQ
jgi:hypothetical protein